MQILMIDAGLKMLLVGALKGRSISGQMLIVETTKRITGEAHLIVGTGVRRTGVALILVLPCEGADRIGQVLAQAPVVIAILLPLCGSGRGGRLVFV